MFKVVFKSILSLILITAILLAAHSLKIKTSSFLDKMAMPDELMFLPSNKMIKTMSLGFDEVVADYYWLKVIQYFGDQKNFDPVRLQRLYPLLDLITDLAPNFEYAYRFGHIALTMKNTNEDDSIKLLKKGLMNRPDIWQIPYYLGYDYWFFKNQPAAAAEYYQDAAKIAPPMMSWLNILAAKMLGDASNPELSIMILESMLNQKSVTDTNVEQEQLEKTLKLAYMERDIKYLHIAALDYKAKSGHCPSNMDELLQNKNIIQKPIEPHGGEYIFNSNCMVISTGTAEHLKAFK